MEFLQQEARVTLPDIHPMNTCGTFLDMIHQRNPPIQTVAECVAALHQEWVFVQQETIQRLICIMR